MSKLIFLMSLLGCLVLSGCALSPAKAVSSLDADAEVLIAKDLVGVLSQLDSLSLINTTLYIPLAESVSDSFSESLAEEFKELGYAVRTAGVNPGDPVVSYVLEQEGGVATYTVSVGSISVRRSYTSVDSQSIRPLVPMQVTGANADGLELDGQLLAVKPAKELETETMAERRLLAPELVVPEAMLQGRRPIGGKSTESNLVALDMPEVVSQPAELSSNGELGDEKTKNMRELGQSNFANVLDDLSVVKEVVLTFSNDSIRMGSMNKASVSQLVDSFSRITDIFSVIGCSNGLTNLAMGQKGLALGRAARVKEELMAVGVPEKNILEEGCWAASHDERMPKRGVVLTLKRRPG